jgi:hypothetical protein
MPLHSSGGMSIGSEINEFNPTNPPLLHTPISLVVGGFECWKLQDG